MNDTQIKTRHGLILQGALAEALQVAGYLFTQDHQYDETCEIPDFLIPDGDTPKIMVETHQTDARDSFRMKTLRAFTAVTESKAHYGNRLASVNVLFGDPDRELPPSNIRAMCGIFDLNIIPRKDAADPDSIVSLEATSLGLAADEDKTTEQGISEVIDSETAGIEELARLLQIQLSAARANRSLFPLWDKERTRDRSLGDPPPSGAATYYKRMMLRALYLTDEDFAELVAKGDPDDCSPSVQAQLIATSLAELEEALDGNHLILETQFDDFIKNPDAPRLRQLCKEVLTETPEMHWFFEDIRDPGRRRLLASRFLHVLETGEISIAKAVVSNLFEDNYLGIEHKRCWFADLVTRYLGISHNRMNNLLRDLNADPQKLGNPFNQLTYKSARFMSNPETHAEYAKGVQTAYEMVLEDEDTIIADSVELLAKRLLDLRLDGAIKLRKLDPLFLVALGAARAAGLKLEPCKISSIVSDLAKARAVGRFEAFAISGNDSDKMVLANFIAVHDNNGDHKSKEWGARRLATLYRMIDGEIRSSEYQEAIFVLDGEWADKDVARLYRSGWNHVVRLDDLEDKLKEIFDLPTTEEGIEIPEIDLPLAAEEDG